MSRWVFWWRQVQRTLWFRVAAYALLGVVAALAAVLFAPFVPPELAERLGAYETVEGLLRILASSLLAVATFSIGAMVTSYTAVASSVTPRVAGIVTDDPQTQNALSTFVGGFLFSIVALVAVEASYYGASGRAIIYIATLGMIGLVALALVNWIGHLGRLARLSYMLDRVEARTREALERRIERPWLGGAALDAIPDGLQVTAEKAGYVLNVDMGALQALAERVGGEAAVLAPPGTFVARGETVVVMDAGADREACAEAIDDAFTIGPNRSFDQDPRFGLSVMGEIAARALSPAINDPATAAATAVAGLRLMQLWDARPGPGEAPVHPRVRVAGLLAQDMIDDVFGPASRHGAGDPVLALPLIKALCALARAGDAETARAARQMLVETLERVEASSMNAREKAACAACAGELTRPT